LSQPKVSIIILNWNGLADTVECLESLKKIAYSNYEVLLVDNASAGDDVKVLGDRFGGYIHIIQNDKNYGFAEGSNIGMRYVLNRGTDYVLLLNNDTAVAPDFLDEMVRVGESDERIGALGPKIYFYDSPNVIWEAGGKMNWWLGAIRVCGDREEDVGQYDNLAERDFLSGAALLLKSQLLQKISLLDSSFFFGFEDYDLCIRARRAGFRVVYVPKAMVWHKVGRARIKLVDYSETQRRVNKSMGIFGIRVRSKFFRKHSRMPPFPIPILLYFAVYWPLRGAELLVFKRFTGFLASVGRGGHYRVV
jgi:GT2 family glycosyltransferase